MVWSKGVVAAGAECEEGGWKLRSDKIRRVEGFGCGGEIER